MTFLQQNLVVNWHLMQPCQLRCSYCYAEWNKVELPLVFRNPRLSERLINEIAAYQNGRGIRLSLAGGEPLLDAKIGDKIRIARAAGLEVSLITNGEFLARRIGENELEKLAMLGVSIDSFCPQKNRAIGRVAANGRVPDYAAIGRYLAWARRVNPALVVKINTVVSRFNFEDDMRDAIMNIAPDKWKVMRVLPAIKRSAAQVISDAQFEVFRQKHGEVAGVQFEDNADMYNSYLMLDPYGRFFFNNSTGYGYSPPVLEVGVEKALEGVVFDVVKFVRRYPEGVK